MNKLYFWWVAVAIAAALYLCGRSVGMARCRADIAHRSVQTQIQIIKQSEDINETVLRTNLGDIRRVMRERYTIAE